MLTTAVCVTGGQWTGDQALLRRTCAWSSHVSCQGWLAVRHIHSKYWTSLTLSHTHSLTHVGHWSRIFMASTILLHVFRCTSSFKLCIYVAAGLPFLYVPWAGSHKIVLNAISSLCLLQYPVNLRLSEKKTSYSNIIINYLIINY